MRSVFLGSGEFAVEPLRGLMAQPGVDVVAVVTAPPRPAGRTGARRATPVDREAHALGVPVLAPDRLRTPEALGSVVAFEPELAVLADYGQIVPKALLDLRLGALNLHPSLLPRHRGATPIQAAILAGDRRTGVTLFRMDEGLDTGPIVASQDVELDDSETTPELERRLATVARELLGATLSPWLRGEVRPRPQPTDGATLTRLLRRADGRLDPARPPVDLARQVRAFQPWPGSFLDSPIGRLSVWRARVVPAGSSRQRANGQPGSLTADGDQLFLETGAGRLELLEVQPAGGRRMPASDFLRGHGRALAAAVPRR